MMPAAHMPIGGSRARVTLSIVTWRPAGGRHCYNPVELRLYGTVVRTVLAGAPAARQNTLSDKQKKTFFWKLKTSAPRSAPAERTVTPRPPPKKKN